VVVRGAPPARVTPDVNRVPEKEDGEIAFESGRQVLSAGYTLCIELEHLPFSLMTYAPWAATATLAGLLLATCLPVIRRRRRTGDH
jgi:hypothetical protein